MNKQRLFWQGISGGQRLCVVYWQVASCCDGMGMESSQDARTTERKAPGFYPMKGAGFWPTHARTPRPRRRQDACVNPMAPFIGRGLRQSEWSSHHLVVVRKNTPCGSFRAAPKFRKQCSLASRMCLGVRLLVLCVLDRAGPCLAICVGICKLG